MFDANLNAYSDIRSQLINTGGGLELINAGPPGALKERGVYSYTFEPISTSDPTIPSRLVSIQDEIGNQQTLNWSTGGESGSYGAVFLTVTDNGTQRQLVFYEAPSSDSSSGHVPGGVIILGSATPGKGTPPWKQNDGKYGGRRDRGTVVASAASAAAAAKATTAAAARRSLTPALSFVDDRWSEWLPLLAATTSSNSTPYLSAVVAIGGDGSSTASVTDTQYDDGGHLTAWQVMGGNGSGPYRTGSYTYDAQFPDAIDSATEDGVTQQYAYADNQGLQDPYDIAIPKLVSHTVGSASDSSTSDGSTPTTSATKQITYGSEGLIPPSASMSAAVAARTTYVYDNRGDQFMYQYSYDSVIDDLGSGVVRSTYFSGPDFSGAPSGTNWSLTQYSPDINHPGLITVTDPLGQWQTYLDGFGNVTSAIDPLGDSASAIYSDDGTLLKSTTDPTGLTTTLHYGENGAPASRLSSVIDPAGNTVAQFGYNGYGQIGSVTNPASVSASGTNEATSFNYDPVNGDLTQTTSPLGDVSTVDAYDGFGDPMSLTSYPDTGNPLTSTSAMSTLIGWDPGQEPISVLLPNGVQTTNTWVNGMVTQVQSKGPDGSLIAQANFHLDSRNRLGSASDIVGTVAQYKYDADDNRTQVIDGLGDTTYFTYGADSEPTGVTWPDSNSASIAYAAGGLIDHTVDERGEWTIFQYDGAGRMKRHYVPWFAGTGDDWNYSYDSAGRVLTAFAYISDGTTQTRTYHYDTPDKWLSAIDYAVEGYTFTVSYTYYGDGKRHTMTSPAGTTTYTYDPDGRLYSLTNPYGETTTWQYDHASRLIDESTNTGQKTIDSAYSYGVSGLQNDPSTAPAYLRTITERVGSSGGGTNGGGSGQPWGRLLRKYTLTHSYSGQLLEQDGTGPNDDRRHENPLNNFSETQAYSYDQRGRLFTDSEAYQAGDDGTGTNTPTEQQSWTNSYPYDTRTTSKAAQPAPATASRSTRRTN